MAREKYDTSLIRKALATARAAKRKPDGKLANRELANRVSQMLRHLRTARRGVMKGQYEIAEYHANQIVSKKWR